MKNNHHFKNKCALCLLLVSMLINSACSRIDSNTDKTILTFAVYENRVKTMQPFADLYEKEKGSVKIRIVPVNPTQVLEPASLSSLADVIYLEGINPADSNGFLDLRPFQDQQAGFNAEDFWPGELDGCTNAAGALNGLPIVVSPIGLFYDKLAFANHSIPLPKAGWTWDDFRQTVEQLPQSNSSEPVFVDNEVVSLLDPILESGLRTGQSADEFANAVSWYVKMALEEKIYPIHVSPATGKTSTQDDWIQRINSKRAILWIDSLDPGIPGPERGDGIFVPFPVGNGQDHTSPAIVNCAEISAGSQHTTEAWEWLAYLSHQTVITQSGIHQPLPARPSVAEKAGTWQGLVDGVKESIQFALNHAIYGAKQPNLLLALRAAVAKSIQNSSDLTQALTAALANPLAKAQATETPVLTPVAINTPVPTPQADQETIHYLANWGGDGFSDRVAALVPDFQAKNPGIRVEFSFGFSSKDGYILRDLAKTFDCFTYYPSGWEPVPEADLLDLEPFLETEDPAFKKDFISIYMDPFRVGGKLYGLPADVDVNVLAYNQELFTGLGLTRPGPDWTLKDLLAAATKAADRSARQPVFGFAASSDLLLDSRGIRWYEFQEGMPYVFFNTPEMAAALDWINHLYVSGAFLPMYGAGLPEKPLNYTDYEAAISNGQVAMWIEPAGKKRMENLKFQIGYAGLPTGENGKSLEYPVSPLAYWISSRSPVPEACWTWIKYLTGTPGVFGGLTPRVSVLSSQAWIARLGEQKAQAVQNSIQNYSGYSYQDRYTALMRPYLDWYFESQLQVLQGKDSRVILAEAQRKADAYYACISTKSLAGMDDTQRYQQIAVPCAQQVK